MKKFLAAICAVLALTTTAGAVEVAAPSALLMEKETGAILYARQRHQGDDYSPDHGGR